jgi:hypothetical protein
MNNVFFNNSWVDLYFFVENKDKLSCLICQKTVAAIKDIIYIYICLLDYSIKKYGMNKMFSYYTIIIYLFII